MPVYLNQFFYCGPKRIWLARKIQQKQMILLEVICLKFNFLRANKFFSAESYF